MEADPELAGWFAASQEFDRAVVAKLKAVRDATARRLELDPGVLCARERLEMVARRVPRSIEELAGAGEMRKWQIAEMGEGFVEALREFPGRKRDKDDSPYRES